MIDFKNYPPRCTRLREDDFLILSEDSLADQSSAIYYNGFYGTMHVQVTCVTYEPDLVACIFRDFGLVLSQRLKRNNKPDQNMSRLQENVKLQQAFNKSLENPLHSLHSIAKEYEVNIKSLFSKKSRHEAKKKSGKTARLTRFFNKHLLTRFLKIMTRFLKKEILTRFLNK